MALTFLSSAGRRRKGAIVGSLALCAALALSACGSATGGGTSSGGGTPSGNSASAQAAASGTSGTGGASAGSADVAGGVTGLAEVPSAKKSGGTLTYAIDSPIYKLDPNVAAAAQDARVMRQMFDGLVARKPDGTFAPWLATKWKISDDGLKYTFTLRDDVTFQDGSTFDAKAVCFNFDRINNPKNGSIFAKGALGPYKSCTAPNATTAIVTFSEAYAPFLSYLSNPFFGMVSPTAVKKDGNDGFAAHPVGTGAFEFVSYTPNDKIVLKKNPDYNWAPAFYQHQGPAYLDGITFKFITDPTVRVGSLQNGDMLAIGNVPEAQVKTVQSNSDLGVYIEPQSGSPFQLHFNTTHPPLDNKDVRAALRESIDVESAVQSLYFGVYQRAWAPLSPTTPGYNKSLVGNWKYDPTAAKKALDAAGWKVGTDGIRQKDGKKLSLVYMESSTDREKRQELQQIFINQWKQVGVQVTQVRGDTGALLARQQKSQYDIAGLSLVTPDPGALYQIFDAHNIPKPGASGFDLSRLDDSDINKALEQMMAENDVDKRMQEVADLQKTLTEGAYSIPIYVPTYTMGVSKKVTGVHFDGESYPIFYDVSLTG